MTCKHEQIRTWVFEDTEEPAGMWSCVKCGLKFEPINQRKPWASLTDDEIDDIYWGAGKHDLLRARDIEAKLREKNNG